MNTTQTSERFLEQLEHKLNLKAFRGYHKSTKLHYDDVYITTLFWSSPGLVIDVLTLEDECCLTSRCDVGINHIFAYYDDDIEDVICDIIELITPLLAADPKKGFESAQIGSCGVRFY